jgi:TRAP-type mannitol/chloroaromatic compound transport system permease small subunit
MEVMLAVAQGIDRILQWIASIFGWLFLVLVAVICWDVITRKMGFQLPGFGSTPLQELEWHLHGMLFLFWLGYAYVRNTHVRIDVFTGHLPWRRQAWLELFGIGVFAIPYSLLATYYSWSFVAVSYLQQESSDAPNGLGNRWIIKGCLFLGLVLLDAAVVSVLLRKIVGLFGPPHLAIAAGAPAVTQSAR